MPAVRKDDGRVACVASSQTLDRAVRVLQLVAGSRLGGIGLSDLVKKTGLTKPTTRRLLLALIDNRLVEQRDEDRRYYAGPETYALGLLASERFGIHRLAAESLTSLAAHSGDAALLSVRHGYETVCLAREEGTYPLRSHVLQPGNRHPIGVGAGGLALLSAMSDAEVDQALAFNAERFAVNYPTLSPEFLKRQVLETRTRGYAINPGLVVKGSYAIAVATQDPSSGMSVAVTIAGVESRFTDAHIQQLAVMLREEKDRLEKRMQRFGHPVTGFNQA
ncbi:IclR family transcriptional regulator [Ralstonia soli]|uniref:IclR family transcriptional regulator n=1 Tax=Ralstonia soli TaxID=2953896 RepID=A0ABT1AEB7_9RALS|nr:IclR family transcriptional regulator [Ralstonia soli]MCO5396734.1 IclR family transcriptional regulator [Ralstonia soli]